MFYRSLVGSRRNSYFPTSIGANHNPMPVALEQRDPQFFFQLDQLSGSSRLRTMQVGGGLSNAFLPGYGKHILQST